jgi:hypothetical protein
MEQPSPHPIEEPHARPRWRFRNRQRGNTLIVALIALTGLATLGAITISSVEGGLSSGTADRSHHIALYAAESGVMAGMRYLDDPTFGFSQPEAPLDAGPPPVWAPAPYSATGFSPIILSGDNSYDLPGLPGNRRPPGHSENIFSPDLKAWYDVAVINNKTDPRYYDTTNFEDSDGRIVFISTGHGPGNATAILEVEVFYNDATNKYTILSWREIE